MKKFLCLVFSMLIGFVLASSVHAAGTVTLLLNGSPAPSSFKSSDIQSLQAKITLPKKLGAYKFDQASVFLTLSHLDIKGSIYYDRPDLPDNWKDSNTITVDLLQDIKDPYGGSFGRKDFVDVPMKQKLDKITADVQLKIFKKTGEKYNTYWDKTNSSWQTETIPIWNAGTVLAQSPKYTVIEGKLTSVSDSKGNLTIAFPDDSWSGNDEKVSGGYGERRQYFSAYVYGKIDGRDVTVQAFLLDASKFTDYPNLYDAIKDDINQAYDGAIGYDERKNLDQRLDLGWSYFVGGGGGRGNPAYFGAVGEGIDPTQFRVIWQAANIAGISGEKAQLPLSRDGFSLPIYVAQKGGYIVIAYGIYDKSYEDKNSGQTKKLSADEKAKIDGVIDTIVAGIKINK
ncbi:hypothetical protein HZC34_01155 [Candidatus Saganbacteria bacterium]|nr:hypothetical protein [Candidatus Saganbacteria bacterium]